MSDRRFIEESFPVKEVGEASAREKSIRHGHISTLHIWWARRPLAASRATAYAALTPAPKDAEEWQKKRDFIIQLSRWENSNNQSLLERARREILEANGGVPPKVLDPFSGGGSYPLEALRLGCESYANDYNPVAVLIEKATLEYPQKFGRPFEGMPDWARPQREDATQSRKGAKAQRGKKKVEEQPALFDPTTGSEPTDFNPLLNAVHYWGKWVLEETYKELASFYPLDPDGSVPVGYIWARTIPCQNPSCGKEIPLIRGYWLAKSDKKKVALYPVVKNGNVEFQIVGDGHKQWPKNFDAEKGTVARAVATCPICGSTIDDDTTRNLFQNGMSGQRLIAAVFYRPNTKGKIYRPATQQDVQVFESAEKVLEQKRNLYMNEWGMDPIPDELIEANSVKPRTMWLYGMRKWGDLFNARQKLSLITFISKVREVGKIIKLDTDFNKAVVSYLAINIDRLVDCGSTLCLWNYTGGRGVKGTFARQAFPMVWDYSESNPFNPEAAGWEVACEKTETWILHAANAVLSTPTISQYHNPQPSLCLTLKIILTQFSQTLHITTMLIMPSCLTFSMSG